MNIHFNISSTVKWSSECSKQSCTNIWEPMAKHWRSSVPRQQLIMLLQCTPMDDIAITVWNSSSNPPGSTASCRTIFRQWGHSNAHNGFSQTSRQAQFRQDMGYACNWNICIRDTQHFAVLQLPAIWLTTARAIIAMLLFLFYSKISHHNYYFWFQNPKCDVVLWGQQTATVIAFQYGWGPSELLKAWQWFPKSLATF